MLATVSDKKVQVDDGTYAHNPSTGLPEKVNSTLDGVLDYYNADVVTANDYYPFGMEMPGRKFSVESGYRYRFNGKEQDKETSSTTTYDYGFRVYNPALGRFLSVDPLTASYPWNSTYCFTENDVIRSIDLDGMEKYIVVNYWKSGKLERTQIEAYRDNDTKQIINVQFIQKGVPLTEMDVLIYDIYDEGTKKEKIIWDEAEDLTKEQKAIFSKSFSIENIVAGEKETINTFTDDVDNGSFTTTKGAKHLFAEKSYIALPIVNSGGTASDNKLKSSYKFTGLSFYGGENQSNGVLPGQGGHKTGEIGRDANSKEFYALPNKIKNDGKVKSIEIIVPAIISVTLNKREQSVIHNSMELLGQAMKNVLQKSGVNHVTYRVEDVYYSPNVVNNVTTNRPKDEIRVNVIK